MMILAPFLVAVVAGIVILLMTWWLKKANLSLFIRRIPGILTIIAAITLFYIGFVNVRGFEGLAYGFLAFFLVIFALASLAVAKNESGNKKERNLNGD